MMNNNLSIDNNLAFYGILITSGIILGCTLYYLFKSNYTANLPLNTESFTNQEIDTIVKENESTRKNLHEVVDNDSYYSRDDDSQITSDYEDHFERAGRADFDEIISNPDLYFIPGNFRMPIGPDEFVMPDVDFDVCSIEELKVFEISSLYSKEITEKSLTEEDLMEIVCLFKKTELATN
jgi:hypothetical protein